MQKLKELIKLSNLCNFQLFASDIEGNISHQKLRNCCVAKKLTSYCIHYLWNFEFFRREFLRNHSVYWTQIFRDNWNCYAQQRYNDDIGVLGLTWQQRNKLCSVNVILHNEWWPQTALCVCVGVRTKTSSLFQYLFLSIYTARKILVTFGQSANPSTYESHLIWWVVGSNPEK